LDKLRDKVDAQSKANEEGLGNVECRDQPDDSDAVGEDACPKVVDTSLAEPVEVQPPIELEEGKKKLKGHGRNSHTAFEKASDIWHSLPESILASLCDKCGGSLKKSLPQIQIVVKGQPNFVAEKHISERVICKCCNRSIVAPTPTIKGGIGKSVIYAPSAAAMLIVLHYGAYIPFNRIDLMHKSWGTPFASSNQWEVVVVAYDRLKPLFDAIVEYAIFNVLGIRFDDTGSIIWTLKKSIKDELSKPGVNPKSVRTGINASAMLMETPEGLITLFFTGLHHAAEIFEKLLEKRDPEALPLNKVTDHANKNYISDNDSVINGACHTHIYLKFLPAKGVWPDEYSIVAEAYHNIYQNDQYAKDQKMSPQDRLVYHQNNSTKWLNKIHEVCSELLKAKKIDRSDVIWPAVSIVVNQWPLMKRFLEVPGILLDTNDVERTLIQIVKYLAASFGYKTENGAEKGDMAMSLITTAKSFGLEPVEYIRVCLENYEDLAINPTNYLPWNFLKNRTKPPDTMDAKVA
jgi:predicted nucleic acid-binding Zn ribbon protein